MDNITKNIDLIIIAGLLLLFISIFLYKKSKKLLPTDREENNVLGTLGSGNATNKNDIKKLSLKEKIELSWKFLYEVTELIVTKFSREDKEAINKLGHILLNNGMRYEHVVDFGIKQNQISISANIEQGQAQQQQTSGLSK
ncbi:MAG: DUF2660 domain-containing protein [Rickettsia endosymbiont of Bryobia graminum]|nr:DUF2660 domain-containing protein [Rickettsia endosymbiont of Bryobia graminum]